MSRTSHALAPYQGRAEEGGVHDWIPGVLLASSPAMAITVPSGSTFTRNNRSRTWFILVGVLAALALIAWLTLNAISGDVRSSCLRGEKSVLLPDLG